MYIETIPPPTRPNPNKRNPLLRLLDRVPWWLIFILLLISNIYLNWSDDKRYIRVWDSIEQGVSVTIYVATRSYAIALALGLILAIMRLTGSNLLYQIATTYVEIVRGIPTLILVFFIALVATPEFVDQLNVLGKWMTQWGIDADLWGIHLRGQNLDLWGKGTYFREMTVRDVPQIYRAMAALAISYSAFLSEVFRAGIQSIEKGQTEAAKSLGFSRLQTMRLIILPQAIRIILPPLGNDFIAMLKETSLVAVLGVEDITRRGQTTATSTFLIYETYSVIAFTYLVLTLSLALMVRLLEMYLKSGKHLPISQIQNWFWGRVDHWRGRSEIG